MAQQPPVGQGLIVEDLRSHSDTPHSVGLFWTSDEPGAETSTWQHTTHNRQISMHPAGFKPAFPASEWPQTHAIDWDRQDYLYRHEIYSSHVINSQTCCGTSHLPYKKSFESVVITTTKTPWWWHVWCAESCRRTVSVGRINLVHV